jgi:serine/threonine-protein kinase
MSPTEVTVPASSRVVVVISSGILDDEAQENIARAGADMPYVLGKSQGAALELISHIGLHPRVIYDYSETVRKGSVMAQHPAAGTQVSPDLESLLLISSGPALHERVPVPLPSVLGLSEAEASARLRQAGLTAQFVHKKSTKVPEGLVSAQIPDRDSLVARTKTKGWFIWLVIALIVVLLGIIGWRWLSENKANNAIEQTQQVTVPKLLGLNFDEAIQKLTAVGLKQGLVTEVKDEEGAAPGEVLRTTPEAGQKVAVGSSIALEVVRIKNGEEGQVISPPTADTAVPKLEGLSEKKARAALKAARLNVSAVNSPSTEVKEGVVITQSPAAGRPVARDTTVVIVLSSGTPNYETTVVVPEVLNLPLADATAKLTGLGLVVKISPENASGSVAKQMPGAGSTVPANSVILLEVKQ